MLCCCPLRAWLFQGPRPALPTCFSVLILGVSSGERPCLKGGRRRRCRRRLGPFSVGHGSIKASGWASKAWAMEASKAQAVGMRLLWRCRVVSRRCTVRAQLDDGVKSDAVWVGCLERFHHPTCPDEFGILGKCGQALENQWFLHRKPPLPLPSHGQAWGSLPPTPSYENRSPALEAAESLSHFSCPQGALVHLARANFLVQGIVLGIYTRAQASACLFREGPGAQGAKEKEGSAPLFCPTSP